MTQSTRQPLPYLSVTRLHSKLLYPTAKVRHKLKGLGVSFHVRLLVALCQNPSVLLLMYVATHMCHTSSTKAFQNADSMEQHFGGIETLRYH